ncbi:MAG: putative toxin-antitoxin system toxin component, PIN family, partial [Phycisphaeraceae bacterium]
MRVVLDTNVLLAAFGFRGICRAVVDVCFDAHELVLSEHILGEVAHHLRDKFGHTADEARQRVAILRDHSHIVTPVEVAADVCRDPNDLPVLGTLAVGHAD